MKLEFSRQIFERYSKVNFHKNPSSGSRIVPCEQKDGLTDMMKLINAFRPFANAPKKAEELHRYMQIMSTSRDFPKGELFSCTLMLYLWFD
jgi:hypothetical protein